MAAKQPSAKELNDIVDILDALPEVKKKIERNSNLIYRMAQGGMHEQYLAYKWISKLVEYIDSLSCLTERDKEVVKYFYL